MPSYLWLLADKAYASVGALPVATDSPGGSADVSSTVASIGTLIINSLAIIGGVAAVFYLIWSGFQYITSGGSPDKAKSARAGIINAIIGIIVIVAAYAIVKVSINLGQSLNK